MIADEFAPSELFNALSENDKKRLFSEGLGVELLHSGLAFAVPLWWLSVDQEKNPELRNGSAFLVDYGWGTFAVTAAHVFIEYCKAKRAATGIGCQLGDVLFDPEARLISCHPELDIATFRLTESEAEQINKTIVMSEPQNWAPLNPTVKNFAFFAGFPAQTRGLMPSGAFATAPYFAVTPITSVTDRQIGCRFNREKSIDFSGGGLPPPGYNIGGVSGGPLLVPTLGRRGIYWRLAGVVVQAMMGDLFEQIVAVRAHYIQSDGQIG